MVACPVVTSHQNPLETGDSALVYVFPSASSIRVFTPRSLCGGAGPVPERGGSCPGVGVARSPTGPLRHVAVSVEATRPVNGSRATPLPRATRRFRCRSLVVLPGCRCGADGLDDRRI